MYRFIPFSFLLILGISCQTSSSEDLITPNTRYPEQHRNQFHFSPDSMWMNDPNGMVYYEGEYHLFYQHYPDSNVWGPMHWGHAVSTDLVHWEHLPIALYPDSLGYIFSGSAVVDWENTSGLGQNGQPPMVAIFTHHDPVGEKAGKIDFQYQSIAYSNDKGRTWTKYQGNPVVPNPGIRDFRDPKVIWDKDSKQWIMVFAAWDHVKFYGSPNLKDWTYLSDFGKEWGAHTGVWECPDLFPLNIDGTEEQKWVLLLSLNPGSYNGGSGTQYFIGDFDGKEFTLDPDFAKNFGREEAYVPEGIVFMDFENGYGDWTTEGEAFGTSPTKGAHDGQQKIEGYTGVFMANSFNNGDKAVGKLISPKFTIEKDYINFQVGGGNDKLKTNISLIVDGKVVKSAAGGNREALFWTSWEVRSLKGKEAIIEINDQHTGGWGHINVDQIMFADEAASPALDKTVWLDYGRDNYAGVTWSDVPENDGRRIFMGWMSNWDYAQIVPTERWRSAMTLPRVLSLKQTEKGLSLFTSPVKELEKLRGKTEKLPAEVVEGKIDITESAPFGSGGIELEFKVKANADFGIVLSNSKGEEYHIGYDTKKDAFFSDRRNSGKVDFSSVFATRKSIGHHVLARRKRYKCIFS